MSNRWTDSIAPTSRPRVGWTAINNPGADAYKKIIAQWLETREDVTDLNNLSYVAGQLLRNFKESVPVLRKIVTTEKFMLKNSRGTCTV